MLAITRSNTFMASASPFFSSLDLSQFLFGLVLPATFHPPRRLWPFSHFCAMRLSNAAGHWPFGSSISPGFLARFSISNPRELDRQIVFSPALGSPRIKLRALGARGCGQTSCSQLGSKPGNSPSARHSDGREKFRPYCSLVRGSASNALSAVRLPSNPEIALQGDHGFALASYILFTPSGSAGDHRDADDAAVSAAADD